MPQGTLCPPLQILFSYCLILALNNSSIDFFLLLGMPPFQLQELNEQLFSQCKTWSYNEKINNVAVIWLKERYKDKIPISSRPGKVSCLLKECSAMSMNTVSGGVIPPCKTWSQACPILYDDFKTSPLPTSWFI